MNTVYFLVMLVAVGWLMVWAAIPPSYRVGRRFWPYDMVSDATAQKDGTPTGDGSGHAAGPADGAAPHSTWRQRAAAAHRGPQATDTRPAGR